jgi:MerR family transcriptional regulator, repressor of the yfmOP operon
MNTTNEFSKTDQLNQKWLSSEEVCHLLMISKRTLQNYRDKKIIPFSQISRKIYYRATDIHEYLLNHYIKAAYQKQEGGVA